MSDPPLERLQIAGCKKLCNLNMISSKALCSIQHYICHQKNLNLEKNSPSKGANPFMRYIALAYMSNPQSTKGSATNVVALEVLRKNGVDIDKLIKLITAG